MTTPLAAMTKDVLPMIDPRAWARPATPRAVLLGGLAALIALAGCSPGDSTEAAVTDAAPATREPSVDPEAAEPPVDPEAAEPPVDPVAAIDPCALVTGEEASAIIRLAVGEPERGTNPARPACTYGAPLEGPVGRVDVHVGEGAENILGIDRDVLNHELTEVPGIGDEAYAKDHQIFFRKGDVWVFIGAVRLIDATETAGPIQEAAERAAARM